MIGLKSGHAAQILNVTLRLATLAAKLGLTLYMGRYFSLADMGTYGLVFGTVMISTSMLGIRLDYVVSRDLVGSPPVTVLAKMRDQAVFYGLNYLVLGVSMIGIAAAKVTDIPNGTMVMIFLLAVCDSVANMTFNNMNSLGHQLLANLLFFIRSGLWALVIAALGFLIPALRTIDVVLMAWLLGTLFSLVVTAWAWRQLPWRSLGKIPVDWHGMKMGVKRCFLIWLGSSGLIAGFYVDRFIVAQNLGLDLAGVVTFYGSFTMALITLVQSGVLAFAYPRLILFHRENRKDEFWHEVRKSAWHVAVLAGLVALGIGITVPLIGHFFHRPILTSEAPTLWLMLFGMWLQANAMTLYFILFARHQDRAIWLGSLLYLIPAFGGNAVLVPLVGLVGIGYGSVIANLFIFLWRLWYVKKGTNNEAVA